MTFSAVLHYRCVFDLRPNDGSNEPWTEIVRTIRQWISGRETTNEAFGGRWMYVGGQWKPPGEPRVLVETSSVVGTGSENSPQFWSIRYEKPCGQVSFRQWRTDIGVTSLPGPLFRVSLTTHHWLLPGYFGEEPHAPNPSAPVVLRALIGNEHWTPFAGSQPLAINPIVLRVGGGMAFRDLLADSQRTCPVILVTREAATGNLLLDPSRLASLLCAGAVVFEAAAPEVSDELRYVLPHRYACYDGMARIYQVGLSFDSQSDHRRHRFVTRDEILEKSPSVIENRIVKSIAQRPLLRALASITTVDDVAAKRRDLRLKELGDSRDLESLQERTNLLFEQNLQLIEELSQAVEDKRLAEAEWTALVDREDELEKDNREIRYDRDNERALRVQADSVARQLNKQVEIIRTLARLPETLEECIQLIELLHPDRVVFTEDAKQAARKASLNNLKGDLHKVWTCLWEVATTLHDLYFSHRDEPVDIEDAFRRTGYEVALSEGSQTKANKKLMQQRKREFEGREIDITPHVKYGRDPRLLRIHYCADSTTRRLIIGHCGGHLDTAGTRRRS
jgi:hypothetical protein